MSNETDKMNYCCDCGWAIRKGFIFKNVVLHVPRNYGEIKKGRNKPCKWHKNNRERKENRMH